MARMRCPRCGADEEHIVVETRNANYSAFNGYHRTWSAYSALRCTECRWPWRSKAAGVVRLPDAKGR